MTANDNSNPEHSGELQELRRQVAALQREREDRTRAEKALRESELKYRDLVETSNDLIWSVNSEGRWTFVNQAVRDIYGYEPEEMLGRPFTDFMRAEQADRDLLVFERIKSGTPHFSYETVHLRKNGERIALRFNAIVLRDAQGNVLGTTGTATDITDRKRTEDRQRLMLQELDHRVKNTLATVLAICDQTMANATSIPQFAEAFGGRVRSLAQVHEALAAQRWDGAQLRDIVERSLAPYRGADGDRVQISGADVLLPVRAALPISMALHELSTNAAKYGSLSVPAGRIEINWEVREGEDQPLQLHWIESRGPAVEAVPKKGFGTNLIDQCLRHELNGDCNLVFDHAGLQCTMTFPSVLSME